MKWPWSKQTPAAPTTPTVTPRLPHARPLKVTALTAVMTRGGQVRPRLEGDWVEPYSVPKPAPGVGPAHGSGGLAMDSMPIVANAYNWAAQGAFREGLGFLGYPYLAELTQRPEYRRISEIIAKEMTRRWITLTSSDTGAKGPKSERLAKLEAAIERYRLQAVFREAAEQDGFFGRSQVFIDTGDNDRPDELDKPLLLNPAKVPVGKLKGFQVIEPMWCYPGAFNATDPLSADYYRPQVWYVMNKMVHTTRLLLFVGRQMPDMLKPAYQFGGLSLSQMAKPYVDNWLRTRQSVSDLIYSFSTLVLKTDLQSILQGGGADDVLNRLAVFNNLRNNSGALAINKESEELANVSTPLGTLDHLQAQAQEHMASVSGIPLVVLLGITPSGLNASSDGEIKTFYAWIMAQQEALFRNNLKTCIDVIQLSEFGDIDPDIGFRFNDLWETNEVEKAAARKSDADTAIAYINAGVIAPEEERDRLAKDDNSLYHGIDLSADAPGLPDPADEGDPDEEDLDPDVAQDAEFREEDHPRRADGKFGTGGGGGKSGAASKVQALLAQVRQRRVKAAELASAGKPMVFIHKNGARTMVAPDLSRPGTWRTTRIDADGEPFGHVENVDPTDAVMEALNSGAELRGAKPEAPKPLYSPADFGANGTAAWAGRYDRPDVSMKDILAKFPADTASVLQGYSDRVDAGTQTAAQHKDADGNYRPERQALHEKMLFDPVHGVVSPEALARAAPKPGEKPTFTILGGRGGSGKSAFNGKKHPSAKVYDADNVILLDADHFKTMMPEYEGWNAGLTHDESSELVERAMQIARDAGVNIVIDGTMKTPSKAVKQAEAMKDAGYRVEAHYMHLPREEAAKRAIERALGDTKRYVPPSIVLANTENEKAFDLVRKLADRWSVFDNQVGRGEPPRLVAASSA